jgi:hypothetical protein
MKSGCVTVETGHKAFAQLALHTRDLPRIIGHIAITPLTVDSQDKKSGSDPFKLGILSRLKSQKRHRGLHIGEY